MAEGDPFEGWVDIVEAARELNIHPQSMRRLIKQNRVPARLYGGKYLIERDQLLMFKSNYDPRPGRKRSASVVVGVGAGTSPTCFSSHNHTCKRQASSCGIVSW